MVYNQFPAVDENFNLPPQIKESLSTAFEFTSKFSNAGTLNVKNYPYFATGNNVSDDHSKIQAALDDAALIPGTTVRIPAGTYKITKTLIVRRGTTIDATGAKINGYWNNTGGTNLLANGVITDSFPLYTGNGDITIIGGIWDSQGHLNGSNLSNGMAFGHAERLTFKNVTIRNLSQGHALDLCGVRKVLIDGCNFEGASHSNAEAIQIDIMSTGAFPAFGPYDATQTKDVFIQGCFIGQSNDSAAWGRGVGSHSAKIDRQYSNIHVVGNRFQCLEAAVRAYNWINSVISNNIIDGSGIYLLPINAASVDDSSLADGTYVGTSTPMRNIICINNEINNASIGVYLSGTVTGYLQYCIVANNNINGCSSYGLRMTECYDCIFNSNIVNSTTNVAISFSGNSRCVVTSNVIRNSANNGMSLISCTNFNVVGNSVFDSAYHGISISGTTGNSGFGSIKDNFIFGSSKAIHNTYQGLELSTSDSYQVIANKIRKNPENTNHAKWGLGILAAALNVHYVLNDLRNSGTTANLNDSGVGSTTVSTNLV
ncbi:tail protein [Arthrobacter phage Kardesai]|uniref:Right handed beta helix domain-containing protein n=1 Tax=Arthrobacter phage Kardesai TaxID=2859474 RepID=A0AAE7VH23_9CAUD|nr:tail protein [Arthrobacter phage Kardesai]QXO12925.1 hypothetical protein SEA_KARDESAI_18 [Arthrobacter phage Kardesai]WBF79064.1 minor tail protein [Arthrobacter phage Hankly]